MLCICITILPFFSVFAQTEPEYQLFLRNGPIIPEKNISEERIQTLNSAAFLPNQKSLFIIQFEQIPGEGERALLKLAGIELLDYIPNNAYVATVIGSLNEAALEQTKVRAVITLGPKDKMSPGLANGEFTSDSLDVWISFPISSSYEEVRKVLLTNQFKITSEVYKDYQIIALRISRSRLAELAAIPEVKYVEPAPGADSPINDKSEANSRANILRSSGAGGYNLQGKGVVVGVGDESNPMRHVDFSNRLINRSPQQAGSHGLHVTGIIGAAGIINEKYKGYAPKATIVSQYYSNIFVNATNYSKDFGMVITNNSYGTTPSTCSDFGEYTFSSYILDQQAFELPYLQHVFAAGNSGTTSLICTNGLGTVLSGYQVAKNVITVGNTLATGLIATTSSKGPVKDGRTKPEISVQGSAVFSTTPTDNYGQMTGTSMASPAVSGGLALLYQRYRDGHSQANPKNALMKALVCNGAGDLGLAGPDYSYGFGWMNLLRSIKMLDNNNYFSDVVTLNATKTKGITVPSNTAQLKVMLYWNDPGASTFSGKNLVNDLDLTVTVPGGASVLPRKHNSATVATGVDNVNNMEQVVIDNPVAGSYSVLVKGKTIPAGSQEYFVVYDTIRVATKLTNPIGGERFVKGDQIYVSWDSYGSATDPFKIEYNDGTGWFDIDGAVANNLRQVSWTIPDLITDEAKVRISQNGTVLQESQVFTVLAMPILTLPAIQCEGYIAMEWTAVPGATDYEILLLKGDEMKSFDFTTNLAYAIGGLSKDTTYYVSVRPRLNENPGRQAIAKSRMPKSGTCEGSISDNDLKIESIVSPSGSGRKFTSTELAAAQQITIRIKNLDDVTSDRQFSVGYSIGPDGSQVNSELISPVIPPGGTFDHTFTVTASMAGTGSYRLKVFATKQGDITTANNSLIQNFRQIDNQPLTIPFSDQLESLDNQEITSNQIGLTGGDRYDFSNSAPIGRLRTFVNTGMASSGTKSLTLDVNRYDAVGSVNYLISTFNLSSYNSATDDLRLSFLYKNYGQDSSPTNKVWIRGNDTSEWLEIYDLFANQNPETDAYKATGNIALSNVLKTNGQSYSSSFQVRWGQWGDMLVADNSSSAGYSFDDISIVSAPNDLQLVSINSPVTLSCGLGSTEQVKVTIRNTTGSTLSSIPIKMQIDDGSIITKTISSIAAATAIQYTFTQTVDLSVTGSHKIKVWVDLSSDGNANNNTKELSFYNAQVVSVFPYLQNFEVNNGSWRAEGTNSSWAYGTPSSPKINRAASGVKAWKTSLSGNYNDQENSYLYSPCFGLAALTNPTLSFSVAMDLDDCVGQLCDVVFVEYSTDGNTWLRLGAKGSGTNWYDETNNGTDSWSIKDYTRWHVSTIPIPSGFPNIRFRFAFQSDAANIREGIAIDDIHIYDLQNNIYSTGTTSSTVTKTALSGSSWVNFTDNNKIIASIMPNSNNLGNTDVKAYINSLQVRSTGSQYYLDRNFTIKPQNSGFASDVTVRLYFPDLEFENLKAANGCAGCVSPTAAYDLAVSKFSSANTALEDGDLANDIATGWSFFPASDVAKVPYDNGYYVEFKTKTFSEFWLAKDQITVSGALPVQLVSFTAKKSTGIDSAKEVRLEWITSSEENFDSFEVELAMGEGDVRQDKFAKIGAVSGKGHSTSDLRYTFRDSHINDFSTRYYRLKMIDSDGSFAFSTVRAVLFDENISANVYPNPSAGIFNLDLGVRKNEEIFMKVYDLNGKRLTERKVKADEQKVRIDLSTGDFSDGVYLLEVVRGVEKQVFKIIRH